MVDMTQLENAIWRIADGRGNDEDVELLRDGGATAAIRHFPFIAAKPIEHRATRVANHFKLFSGLGHMGDKAPVMSPSGSQAEPEEIRCGGVNGVRGKPDTLAAEGGRTGHGFTHNGGRIAPAPHPGHLKK